MDSVGHSESTRTYAQLFENAKPKDTLETDCEGTPICARLAATLICARVTELVIGPLRTESQRKWNPWRCGRVDPANIPTYP